MNCASCVEYGASGNAMSRLCHSSYNFCDLTKKGWRVGVKCAYCVALVSFVFSSAFSAKATSVTAVGPMTGVPSVVL